MAREIVPRSVHVDFDFIENELSTNKDLIDWLNQQAEDHKLTTLLAHADDGIIWGRFQKGWQLSNTPFPDTSPPLRLETLQECRIFGEAEEIYLWREDSSSQWQARLIKEPAEEDEQQSYPEFKTFDEQQLLWGTWADEQDEKGGFTLLMDGAMENRHAPPVLRERLSFDPEHNYRPVRLRIRHYIDVDLNANHLPEDIKVGLSYVAFSRLVAEAAEEVR